jgi:Tfp pilus assembly protein PilF
MKKPLVIALQALFGATVLVGCAGSGSLQPEVKPFLAVRDGGAQANDYYQLGRYYQSKDRQGDAVTAYRKALALDERLAEAHNALGAIYAANGGFEKAIAEITTAITLDPSAPHFRNNLGYAYYLQGKPEEAIANFKAAAALDPSNPRTWNNMGLALAQLREQERSEQALAPASALAPGGPAPLTAVVPTEARAPAGPVTNDTAPGSAGPDATPEDAVRTVTPVALVAPPLPQPAAPATLVPVPAPVALVAPPLPQPAALATLVPVPAPVAQTADPAPFEAITRLPETFAALHELRPAAATTISFLRQFEPAELKAAAELVAALAGPITASTAKPVLEPVTAVAGSFAALEQAQVIESTLLPNPQLVLADPSYSLQPAATVPAAFETVTPGKPAFETVTASERALEPLLPIPWQMVASADHPTMPPLRMDIDPPPSTLVASSGRPGDPAASHPHEPGSGTAIFEVPVEVEVVALAPHALELTWAGMAVIARPATAVEIGVPDQSRFEVSNGNGVTGMARRVDGLLQAVGLPGSRLTNQKPFVQRFTEIQFRDGHEAAAASLSRRLPNHPPIVPNGRLRADVDVRLVLGKDLPRDVALVEPASDDGRWARAAHNVERSSCAQDCGQAAISPPAPTPSTAAVR